MSQKTMILNHIKKHAITQLKAFELYGCFRLSERIREIESMGYKLNHEWTTVKNRFGGDIRVMKYSLNRGK